MAVHAAREYGVRVVGITLSQEQAAYARKRVADEGLTDRVEIRVQDYRDVADGPYDAISSIGMAEHVGADTVPGVRRGPVPLLEPGGRLLNHQIARRPRAGRERRTPSTSSSTPTSSRTANSPRSAPPSPSWSAPGSRCATWSRSASTTPSPCAPGCQPGGPLGRRPCRLAGPGRARVWRLYMAASALAFEHNRIGVNQVLAVRPRKAGASGLPLRARTWGT